MEEKRIHKTSVGGQALIEGVMMQGPRGIATAVRKTDGDIVVKHHEFSHIRDKHKFFGLPIIRGMVNFVESMILGYKMLMYSAEASGMEELEDVEMNKFEKWLTDKLGDKFMNIIMGIATVLGFALAFVIFFYLPVLAFSKLNSACSNALTPWQGTIEGVMKILIFVIYIAIVSQMKDIKRTFMYHGAEHKSIACYEAGKELTVDNVRNCCRFHPRCAQNFNEQIIMPAGIFYKFIPNAHNKGYKCKFKKHPKHPDLRNGRKYFRKYCTENNAENKHYKYK